MKLSKTQRRWFFCATLCILLAMLSALLFDLLLAQWRPSIDLSGHGAAFTLSERSKATLTDTAGTINISSIFPEDSPIALPTGHLLRSYQELSKGVAGAKIEIAYIDPRVETNAAARLMALGVRGTGVFFRQAGRTIFVPESALLSPTGGYDPAEAEAALTAAISRLSRVDGLVIGWLTGHGEPRYDDTDPSTGYSGLRRALENEGYIIRDLSLDVTSGATATIPAEVNLIMIMNPRYPVSSAERDILSDWLDRGGRLLCALPHAGDAGLAPLLERWGVRAGTFPRRPIRRTVGNAGLTTSLSAEHLVTRDLAGQATLTFRAPRALISVPQKGLTLTSLVEMDVKPLVHATADTPSETVTVMLSAERGSRVGEDLAFRPGRLVVVGETGFAENDYLLKHASANRDLSVNAVRWLTGLPGSGAQGGSGVMRFNQDRRTWRFQLWIVAGAVPLLFCLILGFITRRRS